ncbi:MAG: pyridoxamine 5'-phosphate oxidase family protein [bacterium]|nr:pyridoxamine 5'-phosphate oxidase family protein [bacterium]
MRRAEFKIEDPQLIQEFLDQAESLHLGTLDASGAPYVTAVNFVSFGGDLYFHSGPAGTKMANLRRDARVFLSLAEEFAFIPSYATQDEEACAATQFFRSVHLKGLAEEVADLAQKAQVLSALMAKMQPEGRHRPLLSDDPFYQKALKGTALVKVVAQEVSAKFKFGQHLNPETRARLIKSLESSKDRRAQSTLAWMRALPGR